MYNSSGVDMDMAKKGRGEAQQDYGDLDDHAILLINDALFRETSFYYLKEDGSVDTLWEHGEQARSWGIYFRDTSVINFLSFLSLIDMLLAFVQAPTMMTSWISDVATWLELVILAIYMFTVFIRLKYMWKARDRWWDGATEPRWVLMQAVVVLLLKTSTWVIARIVDNTMVKTDGNVWPDVECPNSYVVFMDGWIRAWNWIYFNKNVRESLSVLLQVLANLGPLTAMVLACFIGHFFIFQAMAIGVMGQNGFGLVSTSLDVTMNLTPNFSDALYNLFGLMTTVNHPDVLMWLVDEKSIAMLVIMSFMFFTAVISQNLLLAIVYGDYCAILEEAQQSNAKLRQGMLDTAHELLCKERDSLPVQVLVQVLREIDGDRNILDIEDGDVHEMLVRLIDNKTTQSDDDSQRLGGEGKSKQDGQVDREDMHELMVFFNIPIEIKRLTKPSHRFFLEKRMYETRVTQSISSTLTAKMQEHLDWMNSVGEDKWCATFPNMYAVVFEKGADCSGWLADLNPWQECSALVQIHTAWLMFFLLFTVYSASDTLVTSTYMSLVMATAAVQIIFCAVSFVGEMRRWEPYHFFNPNTKKAYANWSNFLLTGFLILEALSRCADGGCYSSQVVSESSDIIVWATCLAKIMQLINFAVETPSVYLLVKSVLMTFSYIGPHLGLFSAVYYAFAGMGISFFCGKVTQSVTEGGPGFWGQKPQWTLESIQAANQTSYTMGVSPASGTPWDQTMFGSNGYYYNLNYNGYPQAIASLYAIMIQNNWNVNANGAIEVTSQYFRWFFVIYTVVVAFVMINVLVGSIIDALSALRDELIREQSGVADPMEVLVASRIHTTVGPSGHLYSDVWEVGDIPLSGETRYDAALVSNWEQALGDADENQLHFNMVAVDADIASLEKELAAINGGSSSAGRGPASPSNKKNFSVNI